MSRMMLSSQWKLAAACPWYSHHLGLYLQIDGGPLSPGRCFSPPLAGRLGSEGDQPCSASKAWPKALPGLSAWEAAQDFLSGLPCLLDSAWLGGHLGDFTSWDLCLCACWVAQMGVHKLIAHVYWKSSLTWTTWAAFIVLGRKSCRYTWSKVRPGSIPQTMAVARLRGRSAQS